MHKVYCRQAAIRTRRRRWNLLVFLRRRGDAPIFWRVQLFDTDMNPATAILYGYIPFVLIAKKQPSSAGSIASMNKYSTRTTVAYHHFATPPPKTPLSFGLTCCTKFIEMVPCGPFDGIPAKHARLAVASAIWSSRH